MQRCTFVDKTSTGRNMCILDSYLPCLECIVKFLIVTLKNKNQNARLEELYNEQM